MTDSPWQAYLSDRYEEADGRFASALTVTEEHIAWRCHCVVETWEPIVLLDSGLLCDPELAQHLGTLFDAIG
jgi:hypothetical protein